MSGPDREPTLSSQRMWKMESLTIRALMDLNRQQQDSIRRNALPTVDFDQNEEVMLRTGLSDRTVLDEVRRSLSQWQLHETNHDQ